MDLSELRIVSVQPHEEARFQSLLDECHYLVLVRLTRLEKAHFMRFNGETNGLLCQFSALGCQKAGFAMSGLAGSTGRVSGGCI